MLFKVIHEPGDTLWQYELECDCLPGLPPGATLDHADVDLVAGQLLITAYIVFDTKQKD